MYKQNISLRRTILKEWDMIELVDFCRKLTKNIHKKDYLSVRLAMYDYPKKVHEKACEIMGINPTLDMLDSLRDYDGAPPTRNSFLVELKTSDVKINIESDGINETQNNTNVPIIGGKLPNTIKFNVDIKTGKIIGWDFEKFKTWLDVKYRMPDYNYVEFGYEPNFVKVDGNE